MMDTPKNIRQIGNIDVSHKIYVEDYVITYTKSIGEEVKQCGDGVGRAAVLLGHKNITEKDVETYINGLAVIGQFGMNGQAAFSNEMWSSIYDVIKTYYEDEEIVGWLYIGETVDAGTDKRLVNIHSNNFNGKNLIFMYYNADDKEEEFFDYMNNSFIRRKGFYIYYQKNDTMHNYMVAMNSSAKKEPDCDDRVVKDMRNILSKRHEQSEAKKMMKSVYAAGMLVAAVALLVGTTVIYNYNSEQETVKTAAIPTKDTQITGEPVVKEEAPSEIPVVAEVVPSEIPVEAVISVTTENPAAAETAVPTENPAPTENPVPTETPAPAGNQTPADNPATDNNKEEQKKAVSSDKTYSYYTVKEGDTLSTIAENIYNSVYYIDKIKELNGIEDEDTIYYGQRLLIPDK